MERVVLRLMCDERGEISFLFGPWGAVDRAKAIRQIESGERSYTLQRPDGSRAPIDIVDTESSQRLSTFAHRNQVLSPRQALEVGA
jgi:hypothetical protein